MSGEMDASSAGVDFRLIDPPRVSPKSVSPNRSLLLPLTLVLALAAGLFASFAACQIRPVFFDARSLREVTELPFLGTVSKKISEADNLKKKKDFRRFIAALASLVGAYGAWIAVISILTIRTA